MAATHNTIAQYNRRVSCLAGVVVVVLNNEAQKVRSHIQIQCSVWLWEISIPCCVTKTNCLSCATAAAIFCFLWFKNVIIDTYNIWWRLPLVPFGFECTYCKSLWTKVSTETETFVNEKSKFCVWIYWNKIRDWKRRRNLRMPSVITGLWKKVYPFSPLLIRWGHQETFFLFFVNWRMKREKRFCYFIFVLRVSVERKLLENNVKMQV